MSPPEHFPFSSARGLHKAELTIKRNGTLGHQNVQSPAEAEVFPSLEMIPTKHGGENPLEQLCKRRRVGRKVALSLEICDFLS